MKLKAVVSANLPYRLYEAFCDPKLNTWYLAEVVRGCLHVERPNPAGHYIQWPDLSVAWENGEMGVAVSFSQLSVRFDRSGKDFHQARLKIRAKFKEVIERNLAQGQRCWLFLGSQTDKEMEGPDGSWKTLHEIDEILVEGVADPNPELDRPISDFTAKPFQHWCDTKPVARR